MGKTNLDSLELSGDLKAKNITATGELKYDSLAVTGGATVGGALEITQGLSAGGQISSSGDILAVGDIVANGELRAYDAVTFGEEDSPVSVTVNGSLTAGDATVDGALIVGTIETPSQINLVGGLYVNDGDVTVGDDLTVVGDISGATITTTGNGTIGGTFDISGNAILRSDLTLNGKTKFDGVTDALFAVTTADATDETTAIALANANKAAINKLVKYLRTGSTT